MYFNTNHQCLLFFCRNWEYSCILHCVCYCQSFTKDIDDYFHVTTEYWIKVCMYYCVTNLTYACPKLSIFSCVQWSCWWFFCFLRCLCCFFLICFYFLKKLVHIVLQLCSALWCNICQKINIYIIVDVTTIIWCDEGDVSKVYAGDAHVYHISIDNHGNRTRRWNYTGNDDII